MQSAQSKATRKYEEKIGMMSKTYKLKREIVEAFAETCTRMGTSQSAQLTRMMTEFIEKNKEK
ncbi:MAG: chemotaxis protein [Clostridia bacterium]|nr:chemotaxis protein [Clostridia bacterium]